MKKIIVISLLLLFSFSFSFFKPVRAQADFADLIAPNNKLGIHLAVPSSEDMEKAASLVNSNNGDWGYITLVIHQDDMNKDKWQGVFNKARELHLIPIVRLATYFESGHWHAPEIQEAVKLAEFLNSLNWVVKNRYLVLFNEPNHADEWGGLLSPQNFAKVTLAYAKTFKEINPDFFIMMAGFDSAAPTDANQHMDQVAYLTKVLQTQPELFDYLDGWASHSYPKNRYNTGRNSLKNYLWEIALLRSLGVKKNLPVFITESGWSHQEGKTPDYNFLPAEKVAQQTVDYLQEILNDSQVIAITPFILNYQDEPFDHFSWQKLNSTEFYQQYEATQKILKIKGQPLQVTKISIPHELPAKIIKNSTYQIALTLRNDGQDIWDSSLDNYQLQIEGLSKDTDYFFSDLGTMLPFEEKTIWLHLKTGNQAEKLDLKIFLAKNQKMIGNQIDWKLEIVPETTIKLIAKLLFKRKSLGDDFKFLIYNENQEVIFQTTNFPMKNNQAEIKGLKNLIIGKQYRLVLLKPFYLPRQTFLEINENNNLAQFKVLLPFDFNQDGRLSLNDLWSLLKNPLLFKLWLPN